LVRDNQAVRYDPEMPGEDAAQEQAPDAVGRLLAQARMDLGYELAGVAAELRIRLPYLQAIEDTRYQDLPGMPYAIGFVRSYAEFVGLDPEATVALFKTEVRDLAKSKQQLSFPAPKPEGRLPGGALVLLSLVVVAVAYGGWYLWNESGRPFVEMLPALESEQGVELAEAPGEQAAPEPPAVAGETTGEAAEEAAEEETAETVGEADAETAGGTPEVVAGSGVAAAPLIESGDPAAEPEAEAATDAESEGTESPAASAVPAPPQPPAAEAEEPAAEPAAEPAGEVAQDTTEEQAAEAEAETAAGAANEQTAAIPVPAGSGQVYGDEGGGVRVVLIATADSWVQIRGSDDELLFTRVLRPGDSYRVPNQAGLTLLTGNAGGLDVVVDGQRLPTLGPQGAVRRDVPLEADALRNEVN